MDHLSKCRCHLIRKAGSLMLGSGHYCAIPVSPDSLGPSTQGHTMENCSLSDAPGLQKSLDLDRSPLPSCPFLFISWEHESVQKGLERGNYQGEFLLCVEKFCFDLALGMASWYRNITITFPSREELFSRASFISDSPHPHVSVLTSQSCQNHLSLQKEKKIPI